MQLSLGNEKKSFSKMGQALETTQNSVFNVMFFFSFLGIEIPFTGKKTFN